MKSIFNQYLEIRGRLQPNFANFNLDFLSKFKKFEKQVQALESVHPLISKYRQAVKKTRLYLEVRGRTLTRV